MEDGQGSGPGTGHPGGNVAVAPPDGAAHGGADPADAGGIGGVQAREGVRFVLTLRRMAIAFQRYRAVAVRAGFGVGVSEGAALGALHLEGALTPTELAARLNLSTPAVTELLDRLELAGHVRRGPHPGDRRKILVTITEHAAMIIEKELPAFAAILAPVLRDLDGPTRRVVFQALDGAAEAMDHAAASRAAGAHQGARG